MNAILHRAANFTPDTFNAEGLTVDAVISTFADVTRRDARGAYVERLDAAGLDLSRLIGAPVLDGHRQGSARDVIGTVTGHRTENGNLMASIRFSGAPDAAPIVHRIQEGTIRGVSVGYKVSKWAETQDPNSKTRIRTAAAWSIFEVSAVPVPADSGATFRGNSMPLDNEETNPAQHRAEIRTIARAAGLDSAWADAQIDADASVTETRAAAFEEIQRRGQAVPRIRVGTSGDDPAVIRTRQAEALAARMMGSTPSDAARPFMQMGLADYAREALTRSGAAGVSMLGREELLTRAMHTVSDFPELLTGAGNRVLADAYTRAASPLKQLARQRTASDFRPLSTLKLGGFGKLERVNEAGEIKSLTTGEAKESYALETFGGIFSLSRKAIVNDDLGAFSRWGEMMGQAAAETEATQLLALIQANSGNGVKMDDGQNLFHASHGNLAGTGAALSETTLDAARQAMRTQKALDGVTPVNVRPKFLLIGPALELTADKLLAAIYAATTANANAFTGALTVLVEPRITGNGWYVFGDPSTAPVLEYAYLSSAQGPQLSSRDGWEVLGREFRVTLDFGAGATDHRGAYRNAGAA